MQRSNHRTYRSIASSIRARSGDVVAITSSNCMMISEPMEFWREMECSGVRSLSPLSVPQGYIDSGLSHGCPIVRAQELDPFLCDLREFQERDHLEAAFGVSCCSIVHEVERVTNPPLSATISYCPQFQVFRVEGRTPVRILCGHDWNLCAPPIASSVACPGFKPLPQWSESSQALSVRWNASQVVCVVQT